MQYFAVLDLVAEENSRQLENWRQFDQKCLALPRSVEELMIKASNHLEETDVLVPEELAEAIVTWTTNQTHCKSSAEQSNPGWIIPNSLYTKTGLQIEQVKTSLKQL